MIEGKLPYKMKKAERKFWEELRGKIAAAKEAQASVANSVAIEEQDNG